MALRSDTRILDALLWALVAIVATAILILSLGAPVGEGFLPGIDKIFHATAYATLTFLVLLAGVWRPGRGHGRWPWGTTWVVVGAVLLGGSIELAQSLVTRDPNIFDACANLVGTLVGVRLWRIIRLRAG